MIESMNGRLDSVENGRLDSVDGMDLGKPKRVRRKARSITTADSRADSTADSGTMVVHGTGRGKVTARALARRQLEVWAKRYVVASVSVSSVLNAYGALQESRAEGMWLVSGVALSAVIPGMVWGLFQGASWAWRAGMRRVAYAGIGVGCGLLGVSLCHCALAAAALMGLPPALAWSLAIGIDCGLVWAEGAAIQAHEVE